MYKTVPCNEEPFVIGDLKYIARVCYNDKFCGLEVICSNGEQIRFINMSADFFTAWRSTQIIRFFDSVDMEDLRLAYISSIRNMTWPQIQLYAKPVINKVGWKKYNDVISSRDKKIPMFVSSLVLENNGLSLICDELRAGTINLTNDMREMGIKQPKNSKEKLLIRFGRLLFSYAKSRYIPRECRWMWSIEDKLSILINVNPQEYKRIKEKLPNLQNCPDPVIVAIAGYLAEIDSRNPVNGCEMAPFDIDKVKEEAIDHLSLWVVKKQPCYSEEAVRELLCDL